KRCTEEKFTTEKRSSRRMVRCFPRCLSLRTLRLRGDSNPVGMISPRSKVAKAFLQNHELYESDEQAFGNRAATIVFGIRLCRGILRLNSFLSQVRLSAFCLVPHPTVFLSALRRSV